MNQQKKKLSSLKLHNHWVVRTSDNGWCSSSTQLHSLTQFSQNLTGSKHFLVESKQQTPIMIYKKNSNEPKKIVFRFVFGAFFGRDFHINNGISYCLAFTTNSFLWIPTWKVKKLNNLFCKKISQETHSFFYKIGSHDKKNREISK